MTHAIGVEAVGIGKHFGSFHALSEVSLKVTPGSMHGLLGENGERMPFKVPLEMEVGSLAAGERQKTEIIKQLYLERKFLVPDEPTSVLTLQEATEMLGLVRGLAHSGALTIVIITHKLKEVAAFVDEVTVLRRGRMAGTGAVKDLGPADLTAMMIGEPHAPKNPERKGVPSSETTSVGMT